MEISGRFGNRRPNSAAVRCCISAAALLVNVTARIRSGAVPWRINSAMRWVTTRVFPVPAPANTSNGPLSVRTASRCGGLSSSDMAIWRLQAEKGHDNTPAVAPLRARLKA